MKRLITILIVLIPLLGFGQDFFGGGIYNGGNRDGSKDLTYILSGVNITLTTFNLMGLKNVGKCKSCAGFSIITGLSQIIIAEWSENSGVSTWVKPVNYILGAATLSIGTIRLIKARKNKSGLSFHPYSYPMKDGLVFGAIFTLK